MKAKEQKKDTNQQEPELQPTLTDDLITAFTQMYQPAEISTPGVELKSTIEIIEEMETIAEVNQVLVATALKEAGFKFTYTGAGPFWVLLPKVNL